MDVTVPLLFGNEPRSIRAAYRLRRRTLSPFHALAELAEQGTDELRASVFLFIIVCSLLIVNVKRKKTNAEKRFLV